ncbi:DUF742 domain-containing protein [Actinacidiphila yeochonensis]|uniref:DUF742 domain-containing protein n=1 Tax=Actinacidiphila yeochonensis TaxID=89050 RepID=UPI00389965F0
MRDGRPYGGQPHEGPEGPYTGASPTPYGQSGEPARGRHGQPYRQGSEQPFTASTGQDAEPAVPRPGGRYRRPVVQPYSPPQAPPPRQERRQDAGDPFQQPSQPLAEPSQQPSRRPQHGAPASPGQGAGQEAGQGPAQGAQRPDQGRGGAAGSGGRPRTPSGLVRPYAMTGGRTRPRYQLAIEALVSTAAEPDRLRGQLPEHQRICVLCREVKSVAEISALLGIPLGVVRILVADLAEAGLVAIHQPGGDDSAGGQPDVTLLERVLSGLRKL